MIYFCDHFKFLLVMGYSKSDIWVVFILGQQNLEMGGFAVPPSQYNPLAEPSPLGLRLRKSPSLLELIQMKLSQSTSPKAGCQGHGKRESKASAASGDKLKASNFPGTVLRIGNWEVCV